MITSKEFTKRFNTCSAKWNLVFAYQSAAEIKTWEEMEFTGFVAIRNYSEFCYLDVQRMIINMYPNQEYDWEALEKKLDGLEAFLDMVLERLDKRAT